MHSREVATIGYRSGPEWASRFGHGRANPDAPPDFCPDYLIETYLDRQVCNDFPPWVGMYRLTWVYVCIDLPGYV